MNQPLEATAGLDAKWIPGPDHAVDLAINPDFSQVESDVARISANERFALFYPEKRPLFLEGMDLFSTPVQAVYTRSITSPRWGARATGKLDATAYTVLLSDDRGGGTVILPGPYSSSFAPQDFSSRVALARVRHDLGESFVSFLATDREVQGGGYNRVFGPDFQWRPNDADTVTGQLLLSYSEAPDRPDLSPGWNGGTVSGGGADFWWFHSTRSFDVSAEFKSFGDGFRADDGFVPQVGYREGYAETGHTWYPTGFLTRLRAFSFADYQIDNQGGLIRQLVAAGAGMDGRWSSFGRFWLVSDRWRVQEPGSPQDFQEIPQVQLQFILQAAPSLAVSQLYLEGALGQAIDFDNARPGHGGNLTGVAVLRPTDHLALRFDGALRWLNVRPDEGGPEKRLFTAQVERLRMTYTFTSRCFVRLIGQYQETTRDPSLYDGRSATRTAPSPAPSSSPTSSTGNRCSSWGTERTRPFCRMAGSRLTTGSSS